MAGCKAFRTRERLVQLHYVAICMTVLAITFVLLTLGLGELRQITLRGWMSFNSGLACCLITEPVLARVILDIEATCDYRRSMTALLSTLDYHQWMWELYVNFKRYLVSTNVGLCVVCTSFASLFGYTLVKFVSKCQWSRVRTKLNLSRSISAMLCIV